MALAHAGETGRAIDAMNRALRHGDAGGRPTIVYRIMEAAGALAARRDVQPPLCLLAHLHRYLRIFDEAQGEVAMRYARRAIDTGDRPADAWLTIGVILDKRGHHADALAALQRALAIDPRHAEAYRWAATQALMLQDPVLAYRMARAALEAAPDDPFYARPVERLVLREFGDARTMAALMEQALARNPGMAAAHEGLARAAEALGDADRAAGHRRVAAELRRGRSAR